MLTLQLVLRKSIESGLNKVFHIVFLLKLSDLKHAHPLKAR